MEKELREKIQEKAEQYSRHPEREQCESCNENISYELNEAFMNGAKALYSELKPKIEWVDVNERLPEIKERDYQIVVKFDNEVFKEFWVTDSLEYDFDALGVKFWREI